MLQSVRLMIAAFIVAGATAALAGMPAPLPSNWTAEKTPEWVGGRPASTSLATGLRIQAISFFTAVFLISGWMVKGLWNLARRDFPNLPSLTYFRALGLVGLWGLAFVIVLTMISGARELMTPGAWRKQGWTYKLADSHPAVSVTGRDDRRRQLEQVRTVLWQYAATHEGRFPRPAEVTDATLWDIPGWPGLKFFVIPDRRAESAGRLLVYEPELDGDDRLVLLTNGTIGTMRSAEIKQFLAESRAEQSAAMIDSTPAAESSPPEANPPSVERGTP
ncbi:MAG: hypothetical protein JSS49_25030 [Planctomycetes bacterium]|nr:hypothetical protein [Planctomycetota bacterium]